MNFKNKYSPRERYEKFKEDLTIGESGEKVISLYLVCQGMSLVSFNETSAYDILMKNPKTNKEVSFEVKTDTFHKDTGNLAIEIRQKGEPSGLSTSKADWFVYFYTGLSFNNVWMIKIDELKMLIKKSSFTIISGGDNKTSQLVLIPRDKYKKFFRIDTIKIKQYEDDRE